MSMAGRFDGGVFQFSPLREGRPGLRVRMAYRPLYFNSRPCERGDVGVALFSSSTILFQFSPLREGRRS